MCLNNLKGLLPTIATEDITVYKLIKSKEVSSSFKLKPGVLQIARRYSQTDFVTPYQGAQVVFGEVLESKLVAEPITSVIKSKVEQGFHSIKNREDTQKLFQEADWSRQFKLAECIIPKGAEYWEGDFEYSLHEFVRSYASNQIKYVKVIRRR